MTRGKGLHHHHLKKRYKNLDKELPSKTKKFVDTAIYFIGIAGPLMTIPQVIKIFVSKTAAGVSLLSWISYTIIALFWLWYGILHKDKPIIITNLGWFIVDLIIIIGTLIYG